MTATLPAKSNATAEAWSSFDPPRRVENSRTAPSGFKRLTKASLNPAGFVWKAEAVVGKFAELVEPTTVTLPEASRTITLAESSLLPPK